MTRFIAFSALEIAFEFLVAPSKKAPCSWAQGEEGDVPLSPLEVAAVGFVLSRHVFLKSNCGSPQQGGLGVAGGHAESVQNWSKRLLLANSTAGVFYCCG